MILYKNFLFDYYYWFLFQRQHFYFSLSLHGNDMDCTCGFLLCFILNFLNYKKLYLKKKVYNLYQYIRFFIKNT